MCTELIRRLAVSGESFAGRYIPVFADYIVEQNKLECVSPQTGSRLG